MIRYDRTRYSVVVVCDCGWADVAVTQEAAWSLAADHEGRVHPDDRQVRHAAWKRHRRMSIDTEGNVHME